MELLRWTSWCAVEGIKYLIVPYLFFHMDFQKGKWKYLVILYPFLGYILSACLSVEKLYCKALWGILLLLVMFAGTLGRRIEVYVFSMLLISIVDMALWFVLQCFLLKSYNAEWVEMPFGVLFWVVLYLCLRKKRELIGEIQELLPRKYDWILLIGISGIGSLLSCIYGYLIHEMTGSLEWIVKLCVVLVLVFIVVLWYLLIQNMYSRRQLEQKNEAVRKALFLQQRYFEDTLRKEREKRALWHEWNHHIQALTVLCREGNFSEVESYVSELFRERGELVKAHVDTGNRLADYFISETIEQLRQSERFEYQIIGHFPSQVCIDDMDLSVLLANALDNAREALEQVKGRRILIIEIRNYQNRLFVTIENTVGDGMGKVDGTSKKNKREHGFGMSNMRQVADKYGGTLQYHIEERGGDRRFVLDIEI